MLSFEGVCLEYRTRGQHVRVLDQLTFTIPPGQFVVIVGPSGCGKSSLLQLAAGLVAPTRGRVLYSDRPPAASRSKIGMMFQDAALFPWLNVRDNIAFGLRMKGVDHEVRKRLTEEYLHKMGLERFAQFKPYELSGGMKQRAALARTMIMDPELLLMDEPFAALDALTKTNMQQFVRQLWQESRKTVLFVTHDIQEAAVLAERVLVMSPHPGTIVGDCVVGEPGAPDRAQLPEWLRGQLAAG